MKTTFLFLFFMFTMAMLGQQAVDSTTIYYDVIINPSHKADLPAAINYFKKRKKENLAAKDTMGALYSIRMITIGTNKEGNYFESEQEAVAGLALIEGKQYKEYENSRLGLYTELGMVHRKKLEFAQAIHAYTKALSYNPTPTERTKLLNNLANVYKSQGDYIQSRDYLVKALEIANATKKIELQAMVLDNLGEVYASLNNPEALNFLHKSLRLRAQLDNLKHYYTSYMSLAEHYAPTNIDSSKYYAGKAIAISNDLQNNGYKKDALNILMRLHQDGNAREYVRLNDSISKAIQMEENKYAHRKYNVSVAEERTALAEEQAILAESAKDKERSKRLLYQWIGVFIVAIAILVVIVFRLKHKRDQIKKEYATETRISKKVHDEVANDLYKIMAKIQTAPSTGEALLDDLELVYHKTRDISKEHSIIDLDTDYGTLLIDLLQHYQSDSVNIITKNINQIDWSVLDDLKKRTLYRVLQELMTNMRKHSKATLVVITASQEGKKLKIKYTDNGIGGMLKKGNGLLNTENRIRGINGTLIFDSTVNKGVTAKITI